MTRLRPRPPRHGIAKWTIHRATIVGIAAGLGALLVSVLIGGLPEAALYLYGALLALTIACGASILVITIRDMRSRSRGGRMRPIRAFDIAAALLLIVPAAFALQAIWNELF